jgi:hypothetical protein
MARVGNDPASQLLQAGRVTVLRAAGRVDRREGGLNTADSDGRKQHKHEQRAAHRAYIGGTLSSSSRHPSFEGRETAVSDRGRGGDALPSRG